MQKAKTGLFLAQISLKKFYAEGVQQQSPGLAAQRRHPGLYGPKTTSTPKGLHRILCNAFGVKAVVGGANPGCAARAWAMLCNRFAVDDSPNTSHSIRTRFAHFLT